MAQTLLSVRLKFAQLGETSASLADSESRRLTPSARGRTCNAPRLVAVRRRQLVCLGLVVDVDADARKENPPRLAWSVCVTYVPKAAARPNEE